MGECSTSITVRAAVYDLMRRFGLTTVFGNPGSTELAMFLSFPADFRYILGLQESVVVGMADGFAQALGKAALVNLHSAAGVGNAMGNIFTAFRNHTPLVITAGQQARSLLPFDPFLASIQAAELPKPYVKWSIEPARAADVPSSSGLVAAVISTTHRTRTMDQRVGSSCSVILKARKPNLYLKWLASDERFFETMHRWRTWIVRLVDHHADPI